MTFEASRSVQALQRRSVQALQRRVSGAISTNPKNNERKKAPFFLVGLLKRCNGALHGLLVRTKLLEYLRTKLLEYLLHLTYIVNLFKKKSTRILATYIVNKFSSDFWKYLCRSLSTRQTGNGFPPPPQACWRCYSSGFWEYLCRSISTMLRGSSILTKLI